MDHCYKSLQFIHISLVLTYCLFLSQDLSQDTTSHLIVMSYRLLSAVTFFRLTSYGWPRRYWRALVKYFVQFPSIVIFLMFFLWLDWGDWLWRIRSFLSWCTIFIVIPTDIQLDNLDNVVFVKCLLCKSTLSPFFILNSVENCKLKQQCDNTTHLLERTYNIHFFLSSLSYNCMPLHV